MNQDLSSGSGQQSQAAKAPRFCRICGKELTAGASFCTSCGTAVPSAPHSESAGSPTVPPHNPQAVPYQQSAPYQQNTYNGNISHPQTYSKQQASYIPVQNTYPVQNSIGVAPTGKAQKIRKIGLIGFCALALIVAALFLLIQVSFLGLFAALGAVAVLFVVQRILAKKGILLSILLLLAAVVLSFIILAIFLPTNITDAGDLETVITPTMNDTVIEYGKYSITIPGGTITQDETLSITPVAALSGAFSDFEPLCPALDVDLGSLKEFSTPLEIEIPYDKSKIGDLAASEAFVCVFYNEATGAWEDVPYEVDEKDGVVRLIMYHLTTIQCYYSLWEGQFVYDNGSVMVLYHTGGNFGQKYAAYEQAVGRSTGDKYKPQFIVDVADNTSKILKAYADAGLTVPTYPKIYITSDTNEYRTMRGTIMLGADAAIQKDPESEMLVNLAHELFHSAQGLTMGIVDYSAAYYKNAGFWIDASADYMANTGVWELLQQTPINRYDPYGIDFFENSLFKTDGGHEYEAANFVMFMQNLQKATPSELVTLAESYSSFPNSFSSVYCTNFPNLDLLKCYAAFLDYSLFDASSLFSSPSNAALEKEIKNRTDFQFTLDTEGNGTADSPPIEGNGSVSFSGAYSTGFYRFTTNCDTTLSITPSSDVIIYVVDRTQTVRGYAQSLTAKGGVPTEINFGTNEYVIVTQVSTSTGSISFSFKAEPKKLDITGKWNFTQMYFADLEGSPEFFSALQSEFGYDKTSYLAEVNASAQTQAQNMYLVINKTGETQYAAELHIPTGDVIPLNDVQMAENTLQIKGQYDGLWISIKLTIAGEQMTGTMRVQMIVGVGDATWTGVDVIQLTAEHEVIAPVQ